MGCVTFCCAKWKSCLCPIRTDQGLGFSGDRTRNPLQTMVRGCQYVFNSFAIYCKPFDVSSTCKFEANFMLTLPKRFSVQAIATLTIVAHPLGQSNSHSVMLASAVSIGQSLGLHRLVDENAGSVVEREIGRRVWAQLCVQDWFSIPFSEAYLINPLYSTSCLPRNCHDEDLRRTLPNSIPTITSYCRFLTGVAGLMPKLQDAMAESNTLYTKYQAVMKYDKAMRTLATSGRPIFVTNVAVQPNWPKYIPWARRAVAISSSHKIIVSSYWRKG
jgi:hypothetical protein